MSNNRKKLLKKQAKVRKADAHRRGFTVPAGLVLGFAAACALLGGIEITDETVSAKELPPTADDLVLNPETGNYEPVKH